MRLLWTSLSLSLGLAYAQTVSFLPPTVAINSPNVVASCSGCIAVADFNGDGKPDIAFDFTRTLPLAGVVLGNGDGTFGPILPISLNQTFDGPFFTGDFNGDGKTDLIGGSSLFLGTGNGTFSAPVALSSCVDFVADLNRDGKTDLICGTTVLLSKGDGTFRNAGTVGSQAMESVVLVADFNGDGIPDVMIHRISGLFAIVLGHGDGTFGAELQIPYQVDSDRPYNSFLAGDFNGDGKTDLATLSYHGLSIDVLPGNGDGTFGTLIQNEISYPGSFTAAADFNKDGKLDILAGNLIYPGNGDGTFRFPLSFGPVSSRCVGVSLRSRSQLNRDRRLQRRWFSGRRGVHVPR